MKTALIFAGLATLVLACNNRSTTAVDVEESGHATHNDTTSNSKTKIPMNSVTETMDKMMHEMHAVEKTGNNDVDFAAMMVEHHKGAVEMARVEVEKGNNTELKAFSQKVIADQSKEIVFMQDFILNAPKAASANSAEFQKALNNSMMAMMNENTTIYNNIDKDFAAQMIPHHQSAVDMAQAYLQYGDDRNLRTLCQNIINSQTEEINWLKDWLARNSD